MKNILILLGLLVASPAGASSEYQHIVEMKNSGSDGSKMVFEPEVIFIKPGEVVLFKSSDKGHNVSSFNVKGSAPKEASNWKSKVNADYAHQFDLQGVHLIKCMPHLSMGMVGAVVVGAPLNLAEVKGVKMMGTAKRRMKKIIERIEEYEATLPPGQF